MPNDSSTQGTATLKSMTPLELGAVCASHFTPLHHLAKLQEKGATGHKNELLHVLGGGIDRSTIDNTNKWIDGWVDK